MVWQNHRNISCTLVKEQGKIGKEKLSIFCRTHEQINFVKEKSLVCAILVANYSDVLFMHQAQILSIKKTKKNHSNYSPIRVSQISEIYMIKLVNYSVPKISLQRQIRGKLKTNLNMNHDFKDRVQSGLRMRT
jgi:hypothetical protein